MAKLTTQQRKTLSKKVVGMPPPGAQRRMPARPPQMSGPAGYPGMSGDASKMHSLASMGRC